MLAAWLVGLIISPVIKARPSLLKNCETALPSEESCSQTAYPEPRIWDSMRSWVFRAMCFCMAQRRRGACVCWPDAWGLPPGTPCGFYEGQVALTARCRQEMVACGPAWHHFDSLLSWP